MPKDPTAATSGDKDDEWWIGLDRWVLQDGNYTDFVTGESRQFALECSYDRGNRLRRSADTRVDCRYTGSGTGYEVEAEVLRVNPELGEDAFVVDFGLRAYTSELLIEGMTRPESENESSVRSTSSWTTSSTSGASDTYPECPR